MTRRVQQLLKRPAKAALLLLALGLALAKPTFAEDYSGAALGVEISPAEIKVGDHAVATLTLIWEGETPSETPRFPTWQKEWGDAEVIEASPVEEVPGQGARRIYRQEVQITAFRPGTLELPAPRVVIPLGKETVEAVAKGTARLLVGSVLPGEKDPAAEKLEAKGPAGLLPSQAPLLRFLLTTGLLGVALIALLTRLARRLAAQSTPALAPRDALAELPPHEEFLRRLGAIDPGQGDRAFTALSFALRQFLGRILGFKALESTTTEIQRRLRNLLPVTVSQEIVALLRECDRAKFARIEVELATTSQRLEQGRHLARQVFERMRPSEDVAAGKGGRS